MAVRGAHLTANVLSRPSLFELVAQESLARAIRPAIKKLCEVLVLSNPGKFGFSISWFEELYLLADIFLQFRYLHTRGGSFSEAFYGLQRIATNSSVLHLPRRKLQISLICLSVLPYLRRKFDALALKYKLEEADGIPENGKFPKGTRSFITRIHSTFHVIWESLVLMQYFHYISGNSVHHSPVLRIIGVSLVYASKESDGLPWDTFKSCISKRDLRSLPRAILQLLRGVSSNSLEVLAFFLQFLQFWYSEHRHTNITALPVPAAPKINVNNYKNICPICLEKRKVPTVLPVSGYIFCYRCIAEYIRVNHKCPVTQYPASDEDLVRLY